MIFATIIVCVLVVFASVEAKPRGHDIFIAKYEPGPPSFKDRPLDSLDKQYARLDGVIERLKTAAEFLSNIESHLSQLKKFVDEFGLTALDEFETINNKQNETLDMLWEHLDNLYNEMDELENATIHVEGLNVANLLFEEGLSATLETAVLKDASQQGDIASIDRKVHALKDKLFTIIGNEFECFDNNLDLINRFFNGIKSLELSRMCETGEVTLDKSDKRAEVLFQTAFDNTPQVQFSIRGFQFDLDTRDHPPLSYNYGYNHYASYMEPNTIGLIANVLASRTGVTFVVTDLSFGDSQLQTVTLAYQACSIGPGRVLSDAHDVITTTPVAIVPLGI